MHRIGTSGEGKIRTLVADVTRMNSQLLFEVLRRDQLIDVVAIAVGYSEALACAVTQKPDVALISAELDGHPQKGLELCRELSGSSPGTRVVVIMNSSVAEDVTAAFRAGARGLFFRAEAIGPLVRCIRCVHGGQVWAAGREINFLLDAFARSKVFHADSSAMGRLSERERQVVQCVAEGLSNRGISVRLKVSEHTVKNYIFHIFEKLGVSSRVELILLTLGELAASMRNGIMRFPIDDAAVAKYYHESSARGIGVLQYRLGQMYRRGIGVPRNEVEAYVWFGLGERECAVVRGACRLALKATENDMTCEQMREAQRRLSSVLAQTHRSKLESKEITRQERSGSTEVPARSNSKIPLM